MSNKFFKILILICASTIGAYSTISLIFNSLITRAIITGICGFVTTVLLLITAENIVDMIQKSNKKKMKTSENKKIMLKVKFVDNSAPDNTWNVTFVSNENLMYCVRKAMVYAKTYKCKIYEMTQLTTEE